MSFFSLQEWFFFFFLSAVRNNELMGQKSLVNKFCRAKRANGIRAQHLLMAISFSPGSTQNRPNPSAAFSTGFVRADAYVNVKNTFTVSR